ncbi:MAG: methyltransferase, partial [Bacteroidota bacterium]
LKKQVQQQYPANDYPSSRSQRENLNALSSHLWMPVKKHLPALDKAPENPWLKEFYPHRDEFLIRFTDYLGMNGARQWYEKGIRFPGLGHDVHPWYGTYFPTRTGHLELFDQWLSQNRNFGKALDMGTGCGVLSFYMLKHNVREIIATDINPNALNSFSQDLHRHYNKHTVQLRQAAFFEGLENENPGLVVFNPPWLPAQSHTTIDKAMYYDPGFFESFFSQGYATLQPETVLVILFSNFAQAAGITREHPIENEITCNQRFDLLVKRETPVAQKTSGRKNWLARIREKENDEIWVLRKTLKNI